jgi:acyl-CoA synthetase (AMP-forming)/AMP-acid ligase II/acyl carrier protein
MEIKSIYELIKIQSLSQPHDIAIIAPDRPSLSYRRLYQHIEETVVVMNDFGLGRDDRVAIVLPNGPEMATGFLSVAAGATSAPLNPAYRESEMEFYLSDLNAKALITKSDMDSVAAKVAQAKGIPTFHLMVDQNDPAGVFSLKIHNGEKPDVTRARKKFSAPDDIALVLHTSGTTARPKIVPIRQRNLLASAKNIQKTLKLTFQDRCLNVMPLFHIHGLVAAVLATIYSGACIICTPGFNVVKFYDWLDEFQPSWYTAVPTMHQAILARAANNKSVLQNTTLRFVRSSSASLPPQVMEELENTFDAPVIEAYGMTEAAHQMASNPLPPMERKAGTVGPAAGPEIAIMDDTGKILGPDKLGEIVIRGDNVIDGYENNPRANTESFTNSWFRTGDQGYLDEDNYLTITDRLKEIINRGGEKISPREIDEILLDHPDIEQALAFALPHPKLGEEVAAAIILNKNSKATPLDIRRFAANHLADFKVPRKIIILDKIPLGPTGKLQRVGLADKLGLEESSSALEKADYVAPRTETELLLAEIWMDVLSLEKVGINDNFLYLGGDSLQAMQLVSRLSNALELDIRYTDIFDAPTIAQQAVIVEDLLLRELNGSSNQRDSSNG